MTTETSAGRYWNYNSGSGKKSKNEEIRGEFLNFLVFFFSSCLSLSIICHKSPVRSCPQYGVWFDRVNTKTRINEQLFSEVSGKGIKLRKKEKTLRGELDCDFWDHLTAVIQGVP